MSCAVKSAIDWRGSSACARFAYCSTSLTRWTAATLTCALLIAPTFGRTRRSPPSAIKSSLRQARVGSGAREVRRLRVQLERATECIRRFLEQRLFLRQAAQQPRAPPQSIAARAVAVRELRDLAVARHIAEPLRLAQPVLPANQIHCAVT